MSASVRLREASHRFPKGNRIRIAFSTAYWPIVWPSPETPTLTVHLGKSRLDLPVRPARAEDAELKPFLPPESAAPLEQTELRPEQSHWSMVQDFHTGTIEHRRETDDGEYRIDAIDWAHSSKSRRSHLIHPDDPLSARAKYDIEQTFKRGDFSVRIVTGVAMKPEREHFEIHAHLVAYEGETEVLKRQWHRKVPRDHV